MNPTHRQNRDSSGPGECHDTHVAMQYMGRAGTHACTVSVN